MTGYREIVIKIPEEIISFVNCNGFLPENYRSTMGRVLLDGVELSKGHGDLIDRDHIIARLEAASKFFGGENADAFDERFSHGLKEAAIKVAEEPTIIEADKGE